MSKKFIITIATFLTIAIAGGIVIFFAKGYTFSTKEKRVVGTGIINITSQPDAASVFVDGHLTTATNATISSLPPKVYTVKITKEGLIPWERQVEVKEGLVSEIKVTLFPAIPTIYPLTFNGVSNPTLSSDGSKLAFIVPSGKKSGVWVWTMANNQPISFARSSEPHQIVTNTVADFTKATLKWSPDSKQVLVTVANNNYLLNADNLNSNPNDITAILSATLKGWEDDTKARETSRIITIKDSRLKKVASSSSSLKWSPDETKFLSDNRVYDLVDGRDYSVPQAKLQTWLPDSRHLVLVEDTSISIVDFDGTKEQSSPADKAVIYAGKFDDSSVFPWPDSSRLVIVSSFPTPTASEPNLYGINLK